MYHQGKYNSGKFGGKYHFGKYNNFPQDQRSHVKYNFTKYNIFPQTWQSCGVCYGESLCELGKYSVFHNV